MQAPDELLGSLRPGRELASARGRYRLLEPLGQGGHGVVFRAQDLRHGREVALKVLLRPSDKARQRFGRELEATARLSHPHLVRLLDSGEDQGRPFLVMELVRGSSLHALAREREGCHPRQAARWVAEAARAIEHAHALGVLHRDLKPHNVLIDERDAARVVDFGLARLVDRESSLTRTGAQVGTPAFMSPEQVRGEEAGPAADVWGLGATLYYALAGGPPFEAATEAELWVRITSGEPQPPGARRAGVPPALDAVCLRALSARPADRYPGPGALAADLEAWLEGRPLRAARPGRAGALPVPALALALVAALAVAVALLGLAPGEPRTAEPAAGPPAGSDRERQEAARSALLAALEGSPRDLVAALAGARLALGQEPARALLEERLGQATPQRLARLVAPLAHAGQEGVEALLALRRRRGWASHAAELIERGLGGLSPQGRPAGDDPASLLAAADDHLALGALAAARDLAARAVAGAPRLAEAWRVRGQALARLGDPAGAERDLSRAVELVPEQATLLLARAAVRAQSDPEAAREDLERALGLNRGLAPAWAMRGALAASLDPERALRDVDRALELEPERASFLVRRGRVLEALGRLGEAERAAETAAALEPDLGAAWVLRARLIAQQDPERALAAVEEAVVRAPRDAEAWNARGALRTIRGEGRLALADFERALELDPALGKAWLNRGQAWIKLNEPARALADLDRAVELQPGEAAVWNARGVLHLEGGRPAQALKDLERALDLEPGNSHALANRGSARERLGDRQGALADLDRSLELRPNHPDTLRERGRIKYALGDMAGALADLEQGLRLTRRDPDLYHAAGLVLRELGRPREAIAHLDRAVELRPDDARYRVERARLRRALGSVTGALADLGHAVAAEPRSALAWAARGELRHQTGDQPGALSDLDRALELEPGHAGARNVRGFCRLELARPDEALADFEAVVAGAPDRPEGWYGRGVARGRLGDREGARADLRRYLELAPAGHVYRARAEEHLRRVEREEENGEQGTGN